MPKKFLWKIGGEAGFGIMTSGLLFSKIAARSGYYIFDYAEYPSLIKGGHNTYEVLISDQEINTTKQEIDLLICLNPDTYLFHKARLADKTLVVYDEEDFKIENNKFSKISIPFKKILKEEQAPQVMLNNIALGASLALLNWDFKILSEIIERNFAKKGKQIIDLNKKAAEKGFNHVKKHYQQFINNDFPKKNGDKKLILTGNDAFSLGCITANCCLYAAYPMTPSSSVLSTLASYVVKTGMIVRHAEDEIAVINTALGSSWAGARSAVGTSGGGFALMTESISLAGIAEIPIVIFLAQRPAPATGMPTWTEQGDLLFAVNSGHGEFPKIVLAAGDIEEMHQLTAEAFDLADVYQTPVILLSDKLLSESHKSTSYDDFIKFSQSYTPNRGKIINKMDNVKYLRYQTTNNGISPMLIPGQKGIFYQSNSYEHKEDGHTTEDALERVKQVDKRNRKTETYLKNHFSKPKVIGDIEKATIVFISWGGNKGAIIEAIKLLKQQTIETAYLHFTHLYPLNKEKIKTFFTKDKRYILIENNSQGQFGKLLFQETGVEIKEKMLKYNGRPFWAEEIVKYVIRN